MGYNAFTFDIRNLDDLSKNVRVNCFLPKEFNEHINN